MNKQTTNQKQARRDIFYWIDGKPLLSVTEILKIIDKPALRYWFGREVFYAVSKNPSLPEKEALAAPYTASGSAKDRGKTVHSIVENFKTTGEELSTIPPEFRGYAEAFYKFMREVKPEILEQEKTVFDLINRVAGTLDLYVKMNGIYYVLDVKTGKDIYSEVDLQLSAYAHMLRLEEKPVDSIGALLLETGENGLPTGNYKFAPRTEAFEAFLSAKNLYEWQNKEKLIKMEYLK